MTEDFKVAATHTSDKIYTVRVDTLKAVKQRYSYREKGGKYNKGNFGRH